MNFLRCLSCCRFKIPSGRKDVAGKDEFTKLYLSTIKEQKIPVPVDNKGNISENLQLEIINEYKFIDDLKKELDETVSNLKDLKIKVENKETHLLLEPITKYFKLAKGNSLYTNKYIKSNIGEYPVYSSQTTNDGILGKINTYDFDTRCLTWTTDGIHAGTVFIRSNKFSMTTHCGALILKEEFKNDINLSYVYHYLRNNLKKIAIGEQNKRVTVNIMKRVQIPIPYKSGKIDFTKQNEISHKYNKIEEIKSGIIGQIKRLLEINPIIKRET